LIYNHLARSGWQALAGQEYNSLNFINIPKSRQAGTARALKESTGIRILGYFSQPEVIIMKWETPSYSDIRFGFEVTMYINNK